MNVSGNFWVSHEFYTITQNGKKQLNRCLKKPHSFHASCSGSDFYEIVSPKFDELPLVVNCASDLEYLQASFDSTAFRDNFPNVDGLNDLSFDSDDTLLDPCPTFDGRTFKNILVLFFHDKQDQKV